MCKTSCQHHRSFLRGGITSLTPRRLYLHYLESCTACPTQLWASLEDFSHVVAAQPVTELASDPSVCKYRHPPHSLLFTFFKNKCFKSCLCQSLKCFHYLLACVYVHSARTTLGSHFSYSTMWVLRHQEAIKLRGRMLTLEPVPPCCLWRPQRQTTFPFLWKVTLWQPALASRLC